MLNYGRHVLEERRAGLAAPLWLPGASYGPWPRSLLIRPGNPYPSSCWGTASVLATTLTIGAGGRVATPSRTLSGYGLDYCTWLLKEIIWRISRPALRRAEFISGRQGRPPGADPGLGSQVQLPGLPGQASLLKQP
jgi:hypothetical protein